MIFERGVHEGGPSPRRAIVCSAGNCLINNKSIGLMETLSDMDANIP